ncbi:MAG: cytochrome c oxidase subunit II [Sphingomonadales bacterium 32-64-22]|nr:MAG: cytochrome c oxidase subunit II [Sphingomonadales bacterium 32-64-22]
MNFGETLRTTVTSLKALSLGLVGAVPFALLPKAALAQEAAAPAAAAATPAAADAAAPVADAAAAAAPAAPTYTPLGPDMIKGQPEPGGMWLQSQHSPIGHDASWMHDYVLTPVIIAIVVLVLALLLFVIIRFNRRANPVPSKTSHNTMLEVMWTGIPILILVLIAVPSLNLLAEQYKSAPKDALTVKITGYQWYWGYTYPDNGGFEVISNMMPEEEAKAKGFPTHLEVDHRMVVPVGVPIRIQTTAADVIHSFAVPSLWFKLDAVPGRLNEKVLQIDEPGIYYGQCSELCGVRHGYMPIAVEAVPQEKFEQWILSQGGELPSKAAAAPAAPAAAVTPAAAPAPAETATPGAA